MCLCSTSELAQEAEVVAGKGAHVVDPRSHHRQPLDTETESEAAVLVGS
jgi:hypothetical protein